MSAQQPKVQPFQRHGYSGVGDVIAVGVAIGIVSVGVAAAVVVIVAVVVSCCC